MLAAQMRFYLKNIIFSYVVSIFFKGSYVLSINQKLFSKPKILPPPSCAVQVYRLIGSWKRWSMPSLSTLQMGIIEKE